MPCRSVLGGGLVPGWGAGPGGSPIFQRGSPIFQGGGLRGDPFPTIFFGGEFFFDFCFLWGYTPLPTDQIPEYGQRSAGTHRTGMHSCEMYFFISSFLKSKDFLVINL